MDSVDAIKLIEVNILKQNIITVVNNLYYAYFF